ncbi:glycosyl-4,4'-diaponeurosporenoate acyltransferase [Sporosarcina sp. OR05]|uniref:glycosyl-4,4'-diaponeurosporenoate acyltransferase CrtO family protein n=1 Tax=Sporosarcina sp. OR05 TaxID=2969819 RepID=UPI00352B7A98
MPVIDLPLAWVAVLDVLAWFVVHLVLSFTVQRIPLAFFNRHERWFTQFAWEREGAFWQRFCKVKRWKGYIPDGTLFVRDGFNKRQLHGRDSTSLSLFLLESRRAEYVHWLMIVPSFLFFLWNPLWAAWLNVLYAVLFNVPLIIIQRYNRPRLERIISSQ